MLEWKAQALLSKNTYQERKRATRRLAAMARQELRPGAMLAVHLSQEEEKIGVVWRSAYIPDEVGTMKRPKWDIYSGTYRCGNITVR